MSTVAASLTPEWLAELEAVLAAAGPVASARRLALGQVVTGAPGGDVEYTLFLGGGEPAAVSSGVADATVTIVEPYDTAVQILGGASASLTLGSGQLKVRGDVRALLESQELLATFAPLLGARHAGTDGLPPTDGDGQGPDRRHEW
jgi:hypothetical protein